MAPVTQGHKVGRLIWLRLLIVEAGDARLRQDHGFNSALNASVAVAEEDALPDVGPVEEIVRMTQSRSRSKH